MADSIRIKKIPENVKRFYEDAPAVKIGELALDYKYQNKGIGTWLLSDILFFIGENSKKIGVKYVTIDAYCSKRKFYEKNNFNYMNIQNKNKLIRTSKREPYTTVPMYKTIQWN